MPGRSASSCRTASGVGSASWTPPWSRPPPRRPRPPSSIPVMLESGSLMARSRLKATASASNGVPSWKVTSSRRCSTIDSSSASHSVGEAGQQLPVLRRHRDQRVEHGVQLHVVDAGLPDRVHALGPHGAPAQDGGPVGVVGRAPPSSPPASPADDVVPQPPGPPRRRRGTHLRPATAAARDRHDGHRRQARAVDRRRWRVWRRAHGRVRPARFLGLLVVDTTASPLLCRGPEEWSAACLRPGRAGVHREDRVVQRPGVPVAGDGGAPGSLVPSSTSWPW